MHGTPQRFEISNQIKLTVFLYCFRRYEHSRFNKDCPHIQMLADDNLFPFPQTPAADTAQHGGGGGKGRHPDADGGDDERRPQSINWMDITEASLKKDSVIDHLLLVVHGIGTTDESLGVWVSHLRKTLEPAWQRKYLDIPLSVAVDAVSWHDLARAPQETMQNITLPSIQSMRGIINDTMLDVLYYRSPVYGQKMITAVADLLNKKVALYKAGFPNFTGQVSLYCHSLGSVIAFDILNNQPRTDGSRPTAEDINRLMFGEDARAGPNGIWTWPKLTFKVRNPQPSTPNPKL